MKICILLLLLCANSMLKSQNIYRGGFDDGFVTQKYKQRDNALTHIFNGGIGDGFTRSSFEQNDNPLQQIYVGGEDDGFASSSFKQSDNQFLSVYNGGNDDGFSVYTVGSSGNEVGLPVELIVFHGFAINADAVLEWSTGSETGNLGFELQRSIDGVNFFPIAWIEGQGNFPNRTDYNFIDNNLASGDYYYRLKQIDLGGKFVLSNMVVVSIFANVNEPTLAFPNPAIDYIYFDDQVDEVELIGLTGVVHVLSHKVVNQQLEVKQLPKGIYLIKMKVENSPLVFQKMVVQ